MILKSKKTQITTNNQIIYIYFSLKHEQNVLIDFSGFPSCLIDYLKHCIRDEHTDTVSNNSRFQLQLVTEEGKSHNIETHLCVIEISKFKYLTHISLLVTPANDYEIKNYLARRLHAKTVNKIYMILFFHICFF